MGMGMGQGGLDAWGPHLCASTAAPPLIATAAAKVKRRSRVVEVCCSETEAARSSTAFHAGCCGIARCVPGMDMDGYPAHCYTSSGRRQGLRSPDAAGRVEVELRRGRGSLEWLEPWSLGGWDGWVLVLHTGNLGLPCCRAGICSSVSIRPSCGMRGMYCLCRAWLRNAADQPPPEGSI